MTPPIIQFTSRERAQHFWVRHLWADLAIALVASAAWIAAGKLHWIPLGLTEVPADSRRAIFQILATVAATMGGFTLTSISILVNLLRTPMTAVDRLLPADDKRRVGAVFLAVLPWLLGIFVVALASVATDADVGVGYWWLQTLVTGMAVAAVCAISRVVWVLRRLLAVSTD